MTAIIYFLSYLFFKSILKSLYCQTLQWYEVCVRFRLALSRFYTRCIAIRIYDIFLRIIHVRIVLQKYPALRDIVLFLTVVGMGVLCSFNERSWGDSACIVLFKQRMFYAYNVFWILNRDVCWQKLLVSAESWRDEANWKSLS